MKNYALNRKMNHTFLMASTSSITTQSLDKIVQRAPPVSVEDPDSDVCRYVLA